MGNMFKLNVFNKMFIIKYNRFPDNIQWHGGVDVLPVERLRSLNHEVFIATFTQGVCTTSYLYRSGSCWQQRLYSFDDFFFSFWQSHQHPQLRLGTDWVLLFNSNIRIAVYQYWVFEEKNTFDMRENRFFYLEKLLQWRLMAIHLCVSDIKPWFEKTIK